MNINTFSQEYMSITEKPEGNWFAVVGCWMGEMKSGMFYLMYPGTLLIIDKRISEIENICECFWGEVRIYRCCVQPYQTKFNYHY